MPFREKFRNAITRRLSTRLDPPIVPAAQTCHDDARKAGTRDLFYQPGEEPPPKYPGRYNKAHQELLQAYNFGSAPGRRRSIASGVSPMASRAHSIANHSRQSSFNELKRGGELKSSMPLSEIRYRIQQSLFMASDPPEHAEDLMRTMDHSCKRRPSRLNSITEANRETSPDSLSRMDSLSLVDEGSVERNNSATTTEPDYPITPIDSIVGTSFSLPIQTTSDLPLPVLSTHRLRRKSRRLPFDYEADL